MRHSFPAGKIGQEVTSVTLANNTAKTVDTTVPAGKKWILISIKITNPDDVQRTCSMYKYKEAAKTNVIKIYDSSAVGAGGTAQHPNSITGVRTATEFHPQPAEILAPGNTISVGWAAGGASSGGTDADGLVIEYLEVPAE